jgi:hypothetical protein
MAKKPPKKAMPLAKPSKGENPKEEKGEADALSLIEKGLNSQKSIEMKEKKKGTK